MRWHHLLVLFIVLFVTTACSDPGREELVATPTLAARAAMPTAVEGQEVSQDVPPTFTPLPTESADSTPAAEVTRPPTATATATSELDSSLAATPTLVSFVPPRPTATLPPPTPADPAIQSFEVVAVEELGAGRRITFRWRATGISARLFSGTTQRQPPLWDVPVTGERTVELGGTFYRNPEFTLRVFAGDPDTPSPVPQASATVQVPWPCAQEYFFSPAPRRCPLGPPIPTDAAEQQFEGGSMLWLEIEDAILVLYSDGTWQRYPDTWDDSQPEIDPSLSPPEDRSQPRRGFGLVWRERPGVRDLLGWALGPEEGYETFIQYEHDEGSPSGAPVYVGRADDGTVSLYPFRDTQGSWHQETR